MISDEERRHAATELRTAAGGEFRHVDALDVIAGAVGVDVSGMYTHEAESKVYAALADLIDCPIGVAYIPDAMEGNVFCPKCGAEIGEYGVPNYCHNCGMAITNGCQR